MSKAIAGIDFENLQDFFNSDFYESVKNDLTEYIAKEKGIKKESALRNVNRMENYYKQTGKQSRSGRDYIPLIQNFLEAYNNAVAAQKTQFVAIFPSYADAEAYRSDIPALVTTYNTKFEPVVWRYIETQ